MVKKKNAQETATAAEPIAVEEATPENRLREKLEEINSYDGVIGYILRNSTSASIDLKDPTKIIDYAMLSSSAFEVGHDLSKNFELGDVDNIVVEGEDAKMLCLTLNENKISIFLMKNAATEKVLKKMLKR
jgi:predicted regulator of Ras-like GTPase activity (Roadblock/LC7/MglB family)